MNNNSLKNRKIVLLGYMGSGKSAVGKSLSKALNVAFVDLDDYITEKENYSIDEIFSKKGEIYFRKREHIYLKQLVETPQSEVIALGGGTPCYHDNMELLNCKNITTFYLKSSISTLANRLKSEVAKRPIIKSNDSLKSLTEFIAKHLFERQFYYNQAEFIVITDNKSIEQIIDELTELLKIAK